jgi:hypothetical protein
MKGVVFTEFTEMVQEKFSADILDDIIDACDLKSGGVYTAVGTYDHDEILQLVDQLSTKTGVPVGALVRAFGEYLFSVFHRSYPQFFTRSQGSLDFLSGVHDYIHVEVRKLYPDAELPAFSYSRPDARTLVMEYKSTRPLAALAEGLIQGCIAHFKDGVSFTAEDLSGGAGTNARFTMVKPA